MRVDASGCEWMGGDASGGEGMGVEGSGGGGGRGKAGGGEGRGGEGGGGALPMGGGGGGGGHTHIHTDGPVAVYGAGLGWARGWRNQGVYVPDVEGPGVEGGVRKPMAGGGVEGPCGVWA